MEESNGAKQPDKIQGKKYELRDEQKYEIEKIIKRNKNVDWMRLNVYKKEDLDIFLESCKNYIFQNEEYKNILMKDNINIIMKFSEAIKQFKPKPEPESYFILLKAVFNLFQSGMEQDKIVENTKIIIDFISKINNKDEVVLSNFNDLFEFLIFLKVNQINQTDIEKHCKNLDRLLKESLKSNEIKQDNKYINSFLELVNLKIKTQQYVILNLLVEYLTVISQIETKDKLNIIHGILKPIFKLQMDKNTSVAESAVTCYKAINDIEYKFSNYYKENTKLMNQIFEIAIDESEPKNNKINYNSWKLLELFLKKWSELISEFQNNHYLFSCSEKKENIKKRNSASRRIQNNINIKNILNVQGDSIYIPFNLFPKAISVILKSYEYKIDNIEDDIITNYMINIIKDRGKTDIIQEEVTNKILSGMKNKNIKTKEKLKPWLGLLFYIYNNSGKIKFLEFYNLYISSIPIDDINDFILFEELLFHNLFNNTNKGIVEIILEKLLNTFINAEELINKEIVYKSIGESMENYIQTNNDNRRKKNEILDFFEIFSNVLYKITNNQLERQKVDNQLKINIINFEEKIVCTLTDLLMNNSISNFRKCFLMQNIKKRNELFSKLFSIWAINPISVLLLCIILEKFELAYNIILNLKKVKFNNDFYKKLAKLVESFEDDNYEYFCQKLLEPSENIFFIKTLFGILMILPQGVAFDFLSDKLSNVQTLLNVEDKIDKEKILKIVEENKDDIDRNIKLFLNKQENKMQKII